MSRFPDENAQRPPPSFFRRGGHYAILCTVHEFTRKFRGARKTHQTSEEKTCLRRALFYSSLPQTVEHNLHSGHGYGRCLNYFLTNPTNELRGLCSVGELLIRTPSKFLTAHERRPERSG